MMIWLLLIVGLLVGLQVWLTYLEIRIWLKANKRLSMLHHYGHIGMFAHFGGWIKNLPLLLPAVFDGGVALVGGWMGFNGSLIGATAMIFAGFLTSCIIKYHRHGKAKQWEKEFASEFGGAQ